jgi:MoaE-MoaD fusion protein
MCEITSKPLDIQAVISRVEHPGAGATVAFVGTVRDVSRGHDVRCLEYEAYEEMAVNVLSALARAVQRRWPGTRVAMAHRVGVVEIGEASVVIAVSAAHRGEAFEACEYAIDRLKEIAPIWKKEFYSDGEAWIGKGS